MSLACDALITIMVSAVTSGCARVGAFVVVTVAVIASIVMAVENAVSIATIITRCVSTAASASIAAAAAAAAAAAVRAVTVFTIRAGFFSSFLQKIGIAEEREGM